MDTTRRRTQPCTIWRHRCTHALLAGMAMLVPAALTHAGTLQGYWTTDEATKDVAPPGSGDQTWNAIDETSRVELHLRKGDKIWFAFENLEIDRNRKYFALRWGWAEGEADPFRYNNFDGIREDGTPSKEKHYKKKSVEYDLDGERRSGKVDMARFTPQPAWERVKFEAKRDLDGLSIDVCASSVCQDRTWRGRPDVPIYACTATIGALDAMVGDPHTTELWFFPRTTAVDADVPPVFEAPPGTGPWLFDFVEAGPDGTERPRGVRWISEGAGLTAADEFTAVFGMLDYADRRYDLFLHDAERGTFTEAFVAAEPWTDAFDTYPEGPLAGQGDWEPWNGDPTAADFAVTAEAARSEPHALAIDGADDAVQRSTGIVEGLWEVRTAVLVPDAMDDEQHVILLNAYPAGPLHDWSLQLVIDGAAGRLRDRNSEAALPLVREAWTELHVLVDLDRDEQTVFYDGRRLLTKSWSAGVAPGGALNLAAINLYGTDSRHAVHYDDLSVDIASPGGACRLPERGCLVIDIDECLASGGDFLGYREPCVSACPADLDGNARVDVGDLLVLLAAWGECVDCPADLDGDGRVTFDDLLRLLAAWGPCPTD